MRFCFEILHVPGKALVTADALSRAPANIPSAAKEGKVDLADHFLYMAVNALPATPKRLAEIKTKLAEDPVFVTLMSYVTNGWPHKSKLSPPTKPFFPLRDELSVHDGLILRNSTLVVHMSMLLWTPRGKDPQTFWGCNCSF